MSGLARALACYRAWWHGTARLLPDSTVHGPLLRHASTIRPGTMCRRACRARACAMPCWAARLENYIHRYASSCNKLAPSHRTPPTNPLDGDRSRGTAGPRPRRRLPPLAVAEPRRGSVRLQGVARHRGRPRAAAPASSTALRARRLPKLRRPRPAAPPGLSLPVVDDPQSRWHAQLLAQRPAATGGRSWTTATASSSATSSGGAETETSYHDEEFQQSPPSVDEDLQERDLDPWRLMEWPTNTMDASRILVEDWTLGGEGFVREGMPAGTVEKMRLDREEPTIYGPRRRYTVYYHHGSLYVHCHGSFVTRYVCFYILFFRLF